MCGISINSELYCWGNGPISGGSSTLVRVNSGDITGKKVQNIWIGDVGRACASDDSNGLYCWNTQYPGDGTSTQSSTPKKVVGLLSSKSISKVSHPQGYDSSCALDTDGLVYCWGNGYNGDGVTSGYVKTTPVAVQTTALNSDEKFIDIASSYGSTCGVTNQGGVLCWGVSSNTMSATALSPTRKANYSFSGSEQPVAITGAQGSYCLLGSAGSVACWGSNYYGQLGDGTTTNRTSPVLINTSQKFASIDGGGGHFCGVTLSKRVYCWGSGGDSELGNGLKGNVTTTGSTDKGNSSTPVKVSDYINHTW